MSQRNHITMAAMFSLLTALMLAGCGSGNKEGASQGGSSLYGGVATVSETACASCHSSTVDPQTGEPVYGDGTNGYIGSIHQLGYGCQGCHGGGAGHNGIGPLPYPDPALSSGGQSHCATCHSDSTIVSTVDTSIAKFVDSRHNLGELKTSQKCNRCHTHQGAILANNSGFTGNRGVMNALAGAPGDIAEADARHIKCNTCHVSHRPENLRSVSGWDPSVSVGSAVSSGTGPNQYKLCTSCHTYINPDGSLASSNDSTGFYHNTRWYRIIGTTHWDNPATTEVIEGYVLRTSGPNSARPCLDCHGHEYLTNTRQDETLPRPATIWTDWAKSGHAGGLLNAKYAAAAAATNGTTGQVDAVMVAGSTDALAWVEEGGVGAGSSCARCHTSTGAASFLSNPSTYNAANLDFSHRTAGQREMLYCWGCHSNAAAGILRDPGAITVTYTNATISYADANGSNICISCHSGRQVGDDITNAPAADFTNFSEQRPHYLAVAGIVFAKNGYAFATRDYTIPASDQHDKIGMGVTTGNATYDAVRGNYTNGPCVSCHLTSANYDGTGSHTFSPLTKYSATDLALNPICVNCHSTRGAGSNAAITWLGDDATAATLQGSTHKARYQAALEALRVQLAADGFNYYNGRHYIIPIVNPATDAVTANRVTNWGTEENAGAAFNYNLMIHEPAGVAHNRRYTRRLIYDSIDYLDNGVLDYSVSATLNALDATTHVYKASAIAYLINSGTAGTAGERF